MNEEIVIVLNTYRKKTIQSTLLILPCIRRERHAKKTTAYNKRLCGKIAHPLGHPMLKAIAILPKFYSVSYGTSGKRLRHRPRPVSCRRFPVTARKILLAGTSALRKTSHNLDVVRNCLAKCNVRERYLRIK